MSETKAPGDQQRELSPSNQATNENNSGAMSPETERSNWFQSNHWPRSRLCHSCTDLGWDEMRRRDVECLNGAIDRASERRLIMLCFRTSSICSIAPGIWISILLIKNQWMKNRLGSSDETATVKQERHSLQITRL
jgi:hypothetical protein